VETADLSDKALVSAIREVLASAQSGDTDQYNELVQLMYIKKKKSGDDAMAQPEVPDDVDVVAQRETLLKILSHSVACLDDVHHNHLLQLILGTRIWDHKPNVIYALLDLIISLATTSGKHLSSCLDTLVSNLRSQPRKLDNKMLEVLSRVHAALHKISYLVPLAPSILLPILAQSMPSVHDKARLQVVVPYVKNLLKLENSSIIGKVVGKDILMMVMGRFRDLDSEIECDDNLQNDSSLAMFDMELDVAVEGTLVSKLLDDLMVESFNHLKSCQDAGRLDEVFENLFESFENLILNTQKLKFSQFLMFYACSLDPENCGVKFASKLLEKFLSSNNNQVTRWVSCLSFMVKISLHDIKLILFSTHQTHRLYMVLFSPLTKQDECSDISS